MIEVEYLDLTVENYDDVLFAWGYSVCDAITKAGHRMEDVQVLSVEFID